MARLSLSFLGAFQAWLDGQPITGFESNKVRALLVYLSVETDRPHAREALAGLLWPDWPNAAALSNLRYALSDLRQAIGDRTAQPPFLLISRNTLQFNPASDYSLDVSEFKRCFRKAEQKATRVEDLHTEIHNLQSAIELYRGDFLSRFSIGDSAPFEEWALLQSETLSRNAMSILQRLVDLHLRCGNWEKAQFYAQRQLEIEPWYEEAHRQLMLALALGGQRSAALAQYEACRQVLTGELEVEPAGETTSLYEAIRDGRLEIIAPTPFEELPTPGEPPYKGLQYFDETDAEIFFGREELVSRLAFRLASEGFLAVVGASGSGKSSVLRAGLVPALKGATQELEDGGMRPGSTVAQVRVFTPTHRPLQALAAALGAGPGWENRLRSSHHFLQEYLLTAGPTCLVVDQFEELFTVCEAEIDRRAFIENILNAAGVYSVDTENRITNRIVLALRADYYGACAPYPALREALSQRQEYIGPMGAAELRRAIEEPARRTGWSLEPGLVDLLLHDLGTGDGQQLEPGALPLLSHALLETWRRRRGRKLTIAGYIESGRVSGAIARTAEMTYTGMTEQEQAVAQVIFLRLAVLGERSVHRRRAQLSEVSSILGEAPELARVKEYVLKTLADARLVTTTQDSVEVAHEALIHEWSRLRAWLEENQESLRLHRQIIDGALEWERSGQDPGILLRGARLAQSLEWAETHLKSLSSSEQSFLAASHQQEAQESAEREALRQRELEAAQKLAESERSRAEDQARAARQLRRRALLLSLALATVLFLSIFAFAGFRQAARSAHIAEEETRRARADELAAEALNNLEVDPERSIWLTLYALSSAHTPQAESALHQAVQASRALVTFENGPGKELWAVAFSPDGKLIVVSDTSGKVKILDGGTGEELRDLAAHTQMVEDVAFSPDGKLLATASDDSTLKVWKLSTILNGSESNPQPLHTIPNLDHFWLGVTFSPDGKQLAASDDHGSVSIWDLPQEMDLIRSPVTLSTSQGYVWGIAFSPDGKRLAATGDDQIGRVWELQPKASSDNSTARLNLSLKGHTNGLSSIAFSPDGLRLATASYDATARIWAAATGENLLTLYGHATGIRDLVFSPDGQTLYTAGQDGSIKAWDTTTGQERYALVGHAGAVNSVDITRDGQRLATTSRDGSAKIWDISSTANRELLTAPGIRGIYSPDGKRLAVLGFMDQGRTIQFQDWSVSPGSVEILSNAHLRKHGATVIAGTTNPTGIGQASIDADRMAYIWDPSGRLSNSFSLAGHMKSVYSIDLSLDGKLLAVGSNDEPVITLWDTGTGQFIRKLSWPEGEPWGVAFSPDGKRLAAASVNSNSLVWDVRTGKELLVLRGHQSVVTSVVFDRDGKRLVTTSMDGTARVWDAATGAELFALAGHTGTVNTAAFSQDGSRLATGSNNGTAHVWDLQTGKEQLTLTGNGSGVIYLNFNPDGSQLVTGTYAQTVHVYLLHLDDLINLARSRLTRPLRQEECQKFLHQESCPPLP